MKGNIAQIPGVAVFSDELRDGLCGPVGDKRKGAFLAGIPGGEMSVKFGIAGAIEHPQVQCDSVNYTQKPWAKQPVQMISYVSCHDGLCLVDRLKQACRTSLPNNLYVSINWHRLWSLLHKVFRLFTPEKKSCVISKAWTIVIRARMQ